jgi:hypothetical protein
VTARPAQSGGNDPHLSLGRVPVAHGVAELDFDSQAELRTPGGSQRYRNADLIGRLSDQLCIGTGMQQRKVRQDGGGVTSHSSSISAVIIEPRSTPPLSINLDPRAGRPSAHRSRPPHLVTELINFSDRDRRCSDMQMGEDSTAYGMTETSPVSCQTCADDDLERPTAAYRPLPPARRDQDHRSRERRERQARTTRESCAGYSVMLGYWNGEQRTREAIDADGWMHTLSRRWTCPSPDNWPAPTGGTTNGWLPCSLLFARSRRSLTLPLRPRRAYAADSSPPRS